MSCKPWNALVRVGMCFVHASAVAGTGVAQASASRGTMVTIEWTGAVTKSVFEAVWATSKPVSELEDLRFRRAGGYNPYWIEAGWLNPFRPAMASDDQGSFSR